MGMGPGFDPLRRQISELRRRARLLAKTHGSCLEPADGIYAAANGVSVWISQARFMIRVQPGHGPMWQLVYSEDGRGVVTSRNSDGLVKALERLRQLQVLDDLADI